MQAICEGVWGGADLQNVISFTQSKFYSEKFYPKKCVFFDCTKLATKQIKQQITIKST